MTRVGSVVRCPGQETRFHIEQKNDANMEQINITNGTPNLTWIGLSVSH